MAASELRSTWDDIGLLRKALIPGSTSDPAPWQDWWLSATLESAVITFVRVVTSASNSFSVDATDADLLVVARVGDFLSTSLTGTYNGDALTNITDGDAFVQAAYLLAPDTGTNTLTVSADGGTQQVVALLYSGVGAFGSVNPATGAGGVAHNAETTATDGELLIPILRCGSTSGTAFGSTVERYDSGGTHESWVGDFVAGTAGSYDVGVSTAVGASIIILHFTAASGASLTATAAFVAGAATAAVTAVRGHPATASFVSGVASSLVTATVTGNKTATASFSSGSASMLVTASRGRTASTAFQAGSATVLVSATVTGNKTATAAFQAGAAAMLATASVAGNKTLTASFLAGPASWIVSASLPEQGTGRGTASVTVPDGPEGVSVPDGSASVLTPGNGVSVTVPRGTSSVQVQ